MPFDGTIDWNAYWRGDREDVDHPVMVGGGKEKLLTRFVDDRGVPDDAAFVGCGKGTLAAAVAERFPDTRVVGYDAAPAAVERARDEHGDRSNLRFEVGTLPAFDVDRRFDLVYTYATLHYVRDVESAVRSLYRHVREGGHLVCNYPNEATGEEYAGAEGTKRERFALVASGENLTSRKRIADLLDAPVADFWAETDAEGAFVRPSNPCIAVPK